MAIDNRTIGRFVLDGLPPAPRGMPQIEVTFDIDANGILNVSAKDKATGKEQNIRIEASSGLSEAEIDKMVTDGTTYEAEDKKRREEIDARNQADQIVYQTEKQINEMGDKMSADSKAKLEAAVGRVKETLKGSDINEIKSSTEALNQVWQKVAAEMYQQAEPPPGAGPQPGPGPQAGPQEGPAGPQPGEEPNKEDGAVDADFEVVE